MSVTRLAPSPTGALHLGNARTFLVNWLLARQNGWRIVLRVEDLDGPRIKTGADREAIEDLRWLGLDWDVGPIYQSARRPHYAEAVQQLLAQKKAYACVCTRKEIELAASAPHAEDGAAVYPNTCRGRFERVDDARLASGRDPAIRFNIGDADIEFTDAFRGPQRFELRALGDFVIAKADHTPAYQLAVIVDDEAMGVTHVVRGDDLLDSTPRQILLYRALGLEASIPAYYHLPLVIGPDGRRLAKRHGDTRLSYYRNAGVPAERVLSLLTTWLGIKANGPVMLANLLDRFDLRNIPRDPIVFSARDNAMLLDVH